MPVSKPTRIPWIASSAGRGRAPVLPLEPRVSSQEATSAAALNTPSCTGSGISPAFTQLPPSQLPARAGTPRIKAGLRANWPRRT